MWLKWQISLSISLNLSSITRIFEGILKNQSMNIIPGLNPLSVKDDMIKKHMMKTLQEDWTALNDEFLEKLIEFMKNHMQTVIKTDDWHINY